MKGNSSNGEGPPGSPWPGPIPDHPGFTVRREYVDRLGLSEREAAKRLDLSVRTLNELVCGKRDMTERTGLRLEREGVRTAEEWLIQQERYNAWRRRSKGDTNGNGGPGSAAPG